MAKEVEDKLSTSVNNEQTFFDKIRGETNYANLKKIFNEVPITLKLIISEIIIILLIDLALIFRFIFSSSFGFGNLIDSMLNSFSWFLFYFIFVMMNYLLLRLLTSIGLKQRYDATNLWVKLFVITLVLFIELDWIFIIYQLLFDRTKDGQIRLNFTSIIRNTLIWGSLFLAIAMGLTLTYKLLRFPNFAHAEYLVVGGYMAIFIGNSRYFQEGSILAPTALIFGLIFGFLAGGGISVLSDILIFRPLRQKKASLETMMISSLGLSLLIRGLLLIRFTNDNTSFGYDKSSSVSWLKKPRRIDTIVWELNLGQKGSFSPDAFSKSKFAIKYIDVLTVLVIIGSVVATYFIIQRSKIGKAMRATADNPDLAAASGINVERITLFAAFLGGGLAGIAGVFYAALFLAFRPEIGIIFLLPAFAVIILGTVGSLPGALAAAYIMGFGRAISEPVFGGLTDPFNRRALASYRTIVPFVMLIIILLFFEEGIGKRIKDASRAKFLKRENEMNE
ncbi:MAG: branched-chain amino acid ABC transporter permease [Candidatus Heimdallarchaeota archaeon]|nr:branched-chain amino acid ABC transporter permease [Candidatus Heimdallarchaeota archaeon]